MLQHAVLVQRPADLVVAALGAHPPLEAQLRGGVHREGELHLGRRGVVALVGGMPRAVLGPLGPGETAVGLGHRLGGHGSQLGVLQGVAVPEGLAGHVAGLLIGVLVVGGRRLVLGLEHLVLELHVGALAVHADLVGSRPLVLVHAPLAVAHVGGHGLAEAGVHVVSVVVERTGEVQGGGLVVVVAEGHVHGHRALEPVLNVGPLAGEAAGVVEAGHAVQRHVIQLEGVQPVGGGGHVVVGPAHGLGLAEQVDVVHTALVVGGAVGGRQARVGVHGARHVVGALGVHRAVGGGVFAHVLAQGVAILILGHPGAHDLLGAGGDDVAVLVGHVRGLHRHELHGVVVALGVLVAVGAVCRVVVGDGPGLVDIGLAVQGHVVLHLDVAAAVHHGIGLARILVARRQRAVGIGAVALGGGEGLIRVDGVVGGAAGHRTVAHHGILGHICRVGDVVAVELEDLGAHRALVGGVVALGEAHRGADVVGVEGGVRQVRHGYLQGVTVLVGRGAAGLGLLGVDGLDLHVVLMVVPHGGHALARSGLRVGRGCVARVGRRRDLTVLVAVGGRGGQ